MSNKVTEPVMAEFTLVVKAFQRSFNLNNQQMLTIISEAAEMTKRAILLENMSAGKLPDVMTKAQGFDK